MTRDVREAIATLLEGNVDSVQRWLDEVAKTDPAEAIRLFLRLLEFIIPKLPAATVTINETMEVRPRPVRELSCAELEAIVAGADGPEH